MQIFDPKEMPSLEELVGDAPRLGGVGPTRVPRTVVDAAHRAGTHVGSRMSLVLAGVQDGLRYVFQTTAEHVIGTTAASSGGMKMALAGVIRPGDMVLVIDMGHFSNRFAILAKTLGARVRILKVDPGKCPTAEEVKEAIERHRPQIVTMVHGETSTGTLNLYMLPILRLCQKKSIVTVVDTVCTAGVLPFYMDAWGVDVVVTGSQKGLSAMPGCAAVAFSDKVWEERVATNPALQLESADLEDDSISWLGREWYFNPLEAWKFWGEGAYHYTANVHGFYVLYRALRQITQEGLQERWINQAVHSRAFTVGVEAMGLELFASNLQRLQSAIAIRVPEGLTPQQWCASLLKNEGLAVAGDFGGHGIIRVGVMGTQCSSAHLSATLQAIGATAGIRSSNIGHGVAAMTEVLRNGRQLTDATEFMLTL